MSAVSSPWFQTNIHNSFEPANYRRLSKLSANGDVSEERRPLARPIKTRLYQQDSLTNSFLNQSESYEHLQQSSLRFLRDKWYPKYWRPSSSKLWYERHGNLPPLLPPFPLPLHFPPHTGKVCNEYTSSRWHKEATSNGKNCPQDVLSN